ncbi:MAG: transposase [Verrucomicrobia bacterium]|nr:transposase [Verrucomicrobiota bacterium]
MRLKLKRHWHGNLAYYPHRITTAATESIHRIIPKARRRARGFRNFENLKAVCDWMTGRLDLQIPSALTHPP